MIHVVVTAVAVPAPVTLEVVRVGVVGEIILDVAAIAIEMGVAPEVATLEVGVAATTAAGVVSITAGLAVVVVPTITGATRAIQMGFEPAMGR